MSRDPAAAGLDAVFHPETVAVIGASRDPHKWGNRMLAYTQEAGFAGRLYAVNPAIADSDTVFGVPAVPSIADIPERVDLAVVALPAGKTLAAVQACAAAHVGAAVLAASGLGEHGVEGRRVEQRVRAVAAQAGTRLLGPNGFGLFVAAAGVNFTPRPDIPAGTVAMATQSGNVAIGLFGEAQRAGIGYSSCLGVGNQIDIDFPELLHFFAADPATEAVALYVEGLPAGHGPEFRDGLAACRAAGKPVVVLKAGRSLLGAQAAATHTGALAASDTAWQAVLAESGALRAESTQDVVDLLAAQINVPANTGHVMVLTDGGGNSVMAVDAVEQAGLSLARLQPDTVATLDRLAPAAAPRLPGGNPTTLDTAGGLQDDPVLLARCVEAVRGDPGVDIVLYAGVFGGYHDLRKSENDTADQLVVMRGQGTPVVVHSALADANEEPLERLRAGGIPVYPTVQRMIRAVATTATTSRPSIRRESTPGENLPLAETAELLTNHGIAVPALTVVGDQAALAAACTHMTWPACLKLADPHISHKSEVGGVVLNLDGPAAAEVSAKELWRRFPRSPLVLMPMLASGFEMLLGTSQDPDFGPMVLLGRGGIWAEVDPDIVLRPAPTSYQAATDMLENLRCAPILRGIRGQPLDVDALAGAVEHMSGLAVAEPGLSVEVNPLIAYPKGYAAADLRATRVAHPSRAT